MQAEKDLLKAIGKLIELPGKLKNLTSKEDRNKGDRHPVKMFPKPGHDYKEDILPLSLSMQHHS